MIRGRQGLAVYGYDLVRLGGVDVFFSCYLCVFFFQAEDGIRDDLVTGVQTCALPISMTCDAFCPASLRACSFLLTCVRRCPAGLQCIAGHRFPIEGPYGALPCAAYPPSSAAFTSSHLISLPVVSRLRGRVCLGTLLSAGRNNNEISNRNRPRSALCARFGFCVAFCFDSRCARTCPRDGASAVPWRGTDLLQLHFQHTRPGLHPVGEYSLDGTPYVFARR